MGRPNKDNDELIVDDDYVRFDNMVWPRAGKRIRELGDKLVYGCPDRNELIFAQVVLSAYHSLIRKPHRQISRIVSKIREAERI